MAKKKTIAQKQTMNLYYKPDRTTKPATAALYVLFVLVVLLALGKVLIYDMLTEVREERQMLAALETRLETAMAQAADYDEVLSRYRRYSATEEEARQIDRMEILALLDSAVGTTAEMSSLSINGETVVVQFSGVTLAQTAEIVRNLEASPLVASTTVNTASTSGNTGEQVSAGILIALQKEEAA